MRALSLDDIHPLQGDNFTHTLSPAFVQQLDTLVTGDNAPCPLISLQSPTPVLLRVNFAQLNANEADAYLQTLIAHRARHVSLALVSVDKEHALSRLRNLVQSASRPRSLHLPLSRHLAETETAESLLLSLVQACGECGVDLVWYVPEGEWDISPDSWAYARKLKAEDASKKADKEASGQRG